MACYYFFTFNSFSQFFTSIIECRCQIKQTCNHYVISKSVKMVVCATPLLLICECINSLSLINVTICICFWGFYKLVTCWDVIPANFVQIQICVENLLAIGTFIIYVIIVIDLFNDFYLPFVNFLSTFCEIVILHAINQCIVAIWQLPSQDRLSTNIYGPPLFW